MNTYFIYNGRISKYKELKNSPFKIRICYIIFTCTKANNFIMHWMKMDEKSLIYNKTLIQLRDWVSKIIKLS